MELKMGPAWEFRRNGVQGSRMGCKGWVAEER